MLDAAERRLCPWGDAVSFVHADLDAPLLAMGTFDVVFSTAALHWVHDHARLFRSLASVLEPGGRLVARWGGRGNIESVVQIMEERGLHSDRWNFASEAETEAHLWAAGFDDVTVWSHPDLATFSPRLELETFLDSVVLFEALDALPAERRREVVSAVADRLGALSLDYVRLNALAGVGEASLQRRWGESEVLLEAPGVGRPRLRIDQSRRDLSGEHGEPLAGSFRRHLA